MTFAEYCIIQTGNTACFTGYGTDTADSGYNGSTRSGTATDTADGNGIAGNIKLYNSAWNKQTASADTDK